MEVVEFRIFAQMFKLEAGALEDLLHMPGLRPQRVILTVRHADWLVLGA